MAKAYEPCYTRTNKGGGTYVTCEGSQKGSSTKKAKSKISEKDKAGVLARRKAREEKAKKKSSAIGGSPPKGTKVKVGKLNPGKITTTTFPKKKPAQKKVTPKTDKYMERVKFVRANHPYGDTIAFVKINGQKYDWDGVNVKDGFGKKVAELKDPQLLERWFEGEIHKYNIPEVGKLIKDAPKKKPAQKKPAQKKNEVSVKIGDKVISWVVPPHTVSQTETLKLGQKLMKMIIDPKTGLVDNKKFRFTFSGRDIPTELDASEKKYYSDEKPLYIDGKFENERFTWKELDISGKKPKYKTFSKSIKKK